MVVETLTPGRNAVDFKVPKPDESPMPKAVDNQLPIARNSQEPGESRFGDGERQWIVSTENEISKGRSAITIIEQNRKELKNAYEKGLLSREEYVIVDIQALEERKDLSSLQTHRRTEVRTYKIS